MKARDVFSKPKLHAKEEPLRLAPGRMAIWCARDCGNYLVVSIPDQDKFDQHWCCPSCEDDDHAEYFTRHEPSLNPNRSRT